MRGLLQPSLILFSFYTVRFFLITRPRKLFLKSGRKNNSFRDIKEEKKKEKRKEMKERKHFQPFNRIINFVRPRIKQRR